MTTRSTDPASYGAGIASLGTNTLPTTWEHPISWDSLEKYFKGALNKDTRKVFNMLLENSKSLEDHLDTAYLKNSGGTVAGSTTFTGSVTLPGTISLGGTLISTLSFPPTGSIMPYAGSAAPPGWLLCDGTPYSTTTYAALFTVCGSTYNTSAGQSAPTAGNFRVPNLKGRMPVGVDAAITDFNTPGKSGGSTTVTITVAQMPSHAHTVPAHNHIQDLHNHTQDLHNHTQDLHNHTQNPHGHTQDPHDHTTNSVTTVVTSPHLHDNADYFAAAVNGGAVTSGGNTSIFSATATNVDNTASNIETRAVNQQTRAVNQETRAVNQEKAAFDTLSNGSGNAVDNMSPYLVLNYIIKT
jgi:microcystin-dependent protein